jgi:hypothetical protein
VQAAELNSYDDDEAGMNIVVGFAGFVEAVVVAKNHYSFL